MLGGEATLRRGQVWDRKRPRSWVSPGYCRGREALVPVGLCGEGDRWENEPSYRTGKDLLTLRLEPARLNEQHARA